METVETFTIRDTNMSTGDENLAMMSFMPGDYVTSLPDIHTSHGVHLTFPKQSRINTDDYITSGDVADGIKIDGYGMIVITIERR